jgi:branched-subunit amino acid aminotransferase/4-amino-4-deoxychorismate lyase
VHKIWRNSVFQPGEDSPALIPADAVYETLRTHGDEICELAAHLARLENSATALGVPLPSLEKIATELRGAAGPNVVLRIILHSDGTRVMHRRPVHPPKWGRAIDLVTWVDPGDGPPGFAKHGRRQRWEAARAAAGVDEILRVDPQGLVLEAGGSNVFAVVDGVLRTPPLDGRILPGITRGQVLDLARQRDIPTSEAPLPTDSPWEELGLSSSLKGIAPVARIDGIPQPGLGPVLSGLQLALNATL